MRGSCSSACPSSLPVVKQRMNLRIRPETDEDATRITEINDRAFGQEDEGILVQRLRRTDAFDPGLSLVAEVDGTVNGHILFYPVVIESRAGAHQTLALAPMAVIPELQNKGVGSALVTEGIEAARRQGHRSVIVLGHAEYYPRFGFRPASRWDIKTPFEAPDEAFLALELVPGELSDKHGTVKYPAEFEDV